jgi:hypothetical protein
MKCSNPIALLVVLLLGMASANDTFALYRMPVTLPPDLQSPANYMSVTCAGGTEGIVQRLVVFDRNANYSTPDLSQWTDPPEDWPKVNQDIVNIRLLFAASIGNGYSCSCRIQHAGFTEWLGVLMMLLLVVELSDSLSVTLERPIDSAECGPSPL